MVSSSRPALRSSSGRFARRTSPEQLVDRVITSSATPTRSNRIPLRARHSVHQFSSANQPKPTVSERLNSSARKPTRSHLLPRPSAVADRKPPNPPTKVTVTQPHGGLLETVNGVRAHLNITDDDLSSKAPTPRSESINGRASSTGRPQEARSLRSKDGGSRIKSELAIYFGNYDEIINDAPRIPDLIEVDDPILIVDEPSNSSQHPKSDIRAYLGSSTQSSSFSKKRKSSEPTVSSTSYPNAHNAKTIDLSKVPSSSTHPATDPLGDSIYIKPHKRAERKEKRLRNIEKERAQHEKVQLEQILEGLQGPDWLKVLGVTGVTDGERKDWEPKRRHFIIEVQALVDKFRQWREEEKRLKQEREEALAAEEEQEEEEKNDEKEQDGQVELNDDVDYESSAVPDSSDIDAWAARQLKQEAFSTSNLKPVLKRQPTRPPKPTSPEKPFTSFFSKPYLRDQALGKSRHGRTELAFGHPLPYLPECEFTLPEAYVTPEALKSNARKRRRRNRERHDAERSSRT